MEQFARTAAHRDQLVVSDAPLRVEFAPHAHEEARIALVYELPRLDGRALPRGKRVLGALADMAEQLHVVRFLRRQVRAGGAERAAADVKMRGVHAEANLRLFVGRIAWFAAAVIRAAPLDVEQHQQVLAAGLARIVAQAELRRRLALLQQRDHLAQRAADLFEVEIAQTRQRFEPFGKHRPGAAGEIDRQRRDRGRRQRFRGEVHEPCPVGAPA